MQTSLKTGFAQIFWCCPKNLNCPKFGGAAAPLAPPARTPMFQCFPVYPGFQFTSRFRIPAFPYAPDFSFTCIFPFSCLLYCEVLMMLVCNSKEFQFLNELHELNQAFFHSQVVNSDRVERK